MAVHSTAAHAAPQITGAIRQAARSSGISFEYLLTTAQIESNLNPSAQASTSSAKGLYQFIEQTWLGTMKQEGAANGYGKYADAISRGPDGRYEVADPAMRSAIMQLRSDPAASAAMAGAFTRANADMLQNSIGRKPTEGELYIAHFLGPDGAGKLINAAERNPQASGPAMFPAAAAANHSIFYNRGGQPRNAADVYANLSGRFEVARAASFAPNMRTAAVAAPVPPMPIPQRVAQAAAPDTAGVTKALEQARSSLPPQLDTKPLFQAMFTDRAQAVTRTVASLWTPSRGQAAQTEKQARGLDLFTDAPTDSRKIFRGSV